MRAEAFGDYIRRKRLLLLKDDRAYSLRRLAGRLGIQPSYLSRLERGLATALAEANIVALAGELNESPEVLLALAGKIPTGVKEALRRQPERLAGLAEDLARPPGRAEPKAEERIRRLKKTGAKLAEKLQAARRLQKQLRFNQTLLDALMQSTADLINFKDTSGRYLRVSKAFAETFGAKAGGNPDAIHGLSATDLFAPPTAAVIQAEDASVLREGMARIDQEPRRITTGDGKPLHLLTSRLPLRDDSGAVIGTCFIGRDVTELTQAEEMRQASEERLQAHLRNFPLPSFTFRLKGRELILTEANKAAEALFKGRIGAAIGSEAGRLFSGQPDVYLSLWTAFEGRQTTRRRLEYQPPGWPEPGRFDMSFVFVHPDTVMLHAEDVTALKALEQKLMAERDILRTVMDNAPFATCLIGEGGRNLYLNPRFTELLGYTLEDIPDGAAWFARAFPDKAVRERMIAEWQAAKDVSHVRRGLEVAAKDGRTLCFDARMVLLPDGKILMTMIECLTVA